MKKSKKDCIQKRSTYAFGQDSADADILTFFMKTKTNVLRGIIGVLLLLTGLAALADNSLTNGLVAYYPFNGNANDESGNSNHGTTYYTTLTSDRFGQANSAYDFNGNNSYINIGHGSGLTSVSPTGFSISAWVYSATAIQPPNDIRQIVGQRTSANCNGYGFDYGSWSGYGYLVQMTFMCGTGGYVNYEILPDQWYHLAGVFDGSQGVRIYVNGQQKLPVLNDGYSGYVVYNADANIGRNGLESMDKYHDGVIDEVRIYNRALTSNEVWNLYSGNSIPSAPTSVSASDGTYSNKVRVTWSSADNATGYQVWWNTANATSSASLMGTTAATSYDDSSATVNAIYYYWIKATNANGTSDFSASDSGYASSVTSSPAASTPTGVAASDGTYSDKVRVTWSSADNATGYQVWRNSANATSSASLLVATTATSYDDSSVSANVIYYYWVKATNASGASGFSASDSGYASSTTLPPSISAPTGVIASDGIYTDMVAVSWSNVSGATSYEIWRAATNNSSAASNLAETASANYDNISAAYGVTNYYDTSAAGGITYYYWVKAKSQSAVSAFSDPDSGYTALSTNVISGYANLAATEVILLPNILAVGEYPGAVGLQVYNWGPEDLTAPNTRVTLDFYLSANTTFGDADDLWLGDYSTDLTLPAGYAVRVAVTSSERTGFRVPAGAEGINYVFGRVRHASPSTLVDQDPSDNYAMRAGTITVTESESITPGYYVINDYDGDGKSDLALYQETTLSTGSGQAGEWVILLSASGYQTATAVLGGQGYRPALADYDGDGKSDLAVYHQASGQWQFMLSSENYATSDLTMGGPGYVPVPADYDGDGLADPIVYHESSGLWQIQQSATNYEQVNVTLGGNGYKAVAADFDGDGKADIAVFRRSTGDWKIMLSSLQYWTAEFQFGGSGFVPVPADYDADGLTDPAVYKDSTGEWRVMLSKYSYLTATATFGGNGYVAVPADYDGDGKGDVVVYSENASELRILLSGSGYTQTVVTVGGPGYEPVGYYDW